LLRADGTPIAHGGAALAELDRIDLAGSHPRLKEVQIDVACNIHNLLCGEQGVARVFGPQKGASAEVVSQLEAALEQYASVIQRDIGLDVRQMPGGGASGGLGAGLHALLGATLHPRYDIVMEYLDIDDLLRDADLVFTAEGGIDFQTPRGKIPAEVAERAKRVGIPVIALAGTIGKDAEVNYEAGIDAFFSIVRGPSTLEDAIERAPELLTGCAENVMRAILAGRQLVS
jgi:glycerate kinase